MVFYFIGFLLTFMVCFIRNKTYNNKVDKISLVDSFLLSLLSWIALIFIIANFIANTEMYKKFDEFFMGDFKKWLQWYIF